MVSILQRQSYDLHLSTLRMYLDFLQHTKSRYVGFSCTNLLLSPPVYRRSGPWSWTWRRSSSPEISDRYVHKLLIQELIHRYFHLSCILIGWSLVKNNYRIQLKESRKIPGILKRRRVGRMPALRMLAMRGRPRNLSKRKHYMLSQWGKTTVKRIVKQALSWFHQK